MRKRTGIPGPAGQRGWTLLEVVAAIVVVGLGVVLFMRVQHSSNRDSTTNSRILVSGKMIEKFLEDTRINILRDTVSNWPPVNRYLPPTAPSWVALRSVVGPAFSPKDGAPVANVVRLDIIASWTQPHPDSLKVTTYVSKRF